MIARTLFRPAVFAVLGLALVLAPAASAATIFIEKVVCIKAQESDGDELRLHLSLDGGRETTLSRTMKKGQTWVLNRKMEFKSSVRARLTEHDPLSPDDNIDVAKFTNASNGSGGWVFRGNGAEYHVHFSVSNGTFGYLLRLHSLKAVRVQEGNGDDLFFVAQADKTPSKRVKLPLIFPGQTKALNHSIHFFQTATVTFREEDPLNPDDALGTLRVAANPTGRPVTITFSRDGMTYVLTYEVIRKTTPF